MQKIILVLFFQILIASPGIPILANGYGSDEPVQGNEWWALPNSSKGQGSEEQQHYESVPTSSSFPQRAKRNANQLATNCEGMQTHLDRLGKLVGDEILDTLAERNEEIQGVKEKVRLLRGQVKALRKALEEKHVALDSQSRDVKSLQEAIMVLGIKNNGTDKELAWLKSTCLTNSNWDTELHLAASRGDEVTVQNLVGNGSYVDPRNKKFETPLISATYGPFKITALRIIRILIDNGANVYARSDVSRTFLDNLISRRPSLSPSQFHDIVDYLLSRNMSALFSMPGDSAGELVLHLAVKNIEVQTPTLSLLKINGVNLNEVCSRNSNSIIAFALMGKRSLKFLSDLTALGVNWRHLDNNRNSMLHLAAKFGHLEGVKYYCKLGLDTNAINSFGSTPLHYVTAFAKENVLEIVKTLIEHGGDAKIRNSNGKMGWDYVLARGNVPDKEKVIALLN